MKKALLSVLGLLLAAVIHAQTGTDFWFAPPDVTYYHNTPGDEPIYLNVAAGSVAATVTISQPANAAFNGGAPIVLNLAANTATRYNLTSLKAQLETRPTNSVRNTGLRIQSTANITCYYEPSNTNNPDIMALKGANSLGTEFYIPLHKHAPFANHNFSPNNADLAFASFDIVATENNTLVMIYSPVAVDGHVALTPFTVTLQRGQTYSCANTTPATHTDPATHPSGAVVLSDKPIAVSIKDDSNHNPSGGCYDLMLDQIVPVNILGTDYIAVKGALNNTGDESLFLMATENNTQVFMDGNATPVATLFAGQYYRHDMDYLTTAGSSAYARATKPVYAIHVTGFGCEQGMAILPPLNCAGSTQLSFTRSTNEAFFLNLLVRNGSQDDFVVTPATAAIPASAFQAVPGTGGVWMAARIQYNTTEIPVNQAFNVTNTTDVFSLAIINGGGGSGCRYGFFSEFSGRITVNAGVNQNRCADQNIVLAGSVTGGSTTGIWSSNGSGTFTPSATALNATYVPSVGDIALGTVTLTLTSTGNCTPVSDDMTVTITPRPQPEAGPDQNVCRNNPAVTLSGSVLNAAGGVWTGGAGTFLPSNSNMNATYTPTNAEVLAGSIRVFLTTTGNGVCTAVRDSMLVTFTPAPTVNAGADQSRCANNAAASLTGSFTVATGVVWTGGAGSFDPSTTNQNVTYTPTAAEIASGSVTLTLTTTGNGNCTAVNDQVTLNFTPGPTASAGANSSSCANNATIGLNGTVTVATGGTWSGGTGVFSPNNTTLNATYAPTAAEIAAGTLTLTLSTTGNGNCLPATSNRTITFTPAPTVSAGANGTVCANNSAINLNGSVTGATGAVWSGGTGTYSPNNTALNATYTPSAAERTAGTVTLTLTTVGNGTCNAESAQVTYTITPAPTANAGADRVVCANNAAVTLNGSFTVATGGVWSGGAGTFDPSTTNMNAIYTPTAAEIANGNVTLTLTTTGNAGCVAVTDQMTISFTPAAVVSAGGPVSVCANNAVVSLSGSVSGATGGVWSGGAGAYAPDNTTLNATYTPTAGEIAAGTLTLTLTSTGNGTCLPVTSSRVITFTPSPIVDAGVNGAVCANNSTITLAGSITGAAGGTWSGGGGTYAPNTTTLNATYVPTAAERTAGTVTLTLTSTGNGTCNAVIDQVTFTITPAPTANAGADQTLCSNNAGASLGGSFTIATGGVWSGGSGTFDPSTTNMNATYTPTAAEIANGNITLTLTTTGNGTCAPVSDNITLNFTASPVVSAGAAVSVCANNANVSLNGSVTGATGGIWSGGAGSFVPNNTALNATYTPTAEEIAAGTMTLTLTSTGNGNCLPVSSSRVITFTPAPVVNAGANAAVCANNSAITLAGSVTGASGGTWTGGGGSYSPNNTTLNATYAPTAAERAAGTVTLTLTSTGNGTCNAVTDQVTFTITPAPTANAGADQTLCSNNAVASLGGSFTIATGGVWSGGNGSFDPSTTNMNATYTPTAAEIASGSVTLTLTTSGNGTCNQVSDNITLNFTASPVVNAGADVSLCANNASIALNGSVTVATGGVWTGGLGSFNPNNATLNASYTPTAAEIAAGTLTLTLTSTGNGTCNQVSDSRVITFTPAPTANAGANGAVCANNAAIVLNGSVTVATGGIWSGGTGVFSPNNTTLNATYAPSAAERTAGTVTLTLTTVANGTCNAVSDQVTYSITPAPTATAGADQTLCGNNANATLNGGYTVATGIIWSGGAGTFTPGNTAVNPVYAPTATEIANGSVTLTATTTGIGTCNAVSDAMTLTFTPAPTANAGADVTLCANNASVSLSGTITLATGGIWSGGAGTYTPNNTALNATYTPTAAELAGGILTLTLTTTGNGTCNAATDSRVITFTPAPVVDAGANGSVCANASTITLNGSVSGAGGGIWSGGAGAFTPSNTTLNATYMPSTAERAAGTVTLTLTSTGNGLCNAVSDAVTFTISPAPTANAGADQTLCSNNPVATLVGGFTVATGAVWSGGAGTFFPSTTNMNATYTPTATEVANGGVMLTLTTTGNGLCVAVSDQILLNFSPSPTANAGADVSLCVNNPAVALSGAVTTATGSIWSGGAGSFTPNNTALNGTYTPTSSELAAGTLTLTLTTTGNGNCIAVQDSRVITFTPAPIVSAGSNGTVCANAALINLNGSVSGASGAIWSGGAGAFTPNNTTLNATYSPTAAEISNGAVTLTLTSAGNGNCNAVSGSVTYSITPSPTANAGADISLCSNNAAAALNGSITVATGAVWSGGNGTYSPSNTNLGAVYTPSAAEVANGTVTLTLTTTGNGLCNAVSDNMVLVFTPAPTVNAGADIAICANNPAIALVGSVGGATGGVWSGGNGSFTPNNTVLNGSYTPTGAEIANGTLTLLLTTTGNGNCAAVSDERVITFTPAPTVNAGVNATVCANNPAITLAGSVAGASGGVWSGGAGSFAPNNTTLNATYTPTTAERTAGSVNLTLTSTGNGNCNAVSDQVLWTISPAPTANAGADQSLCANNAIATLNGGVTVATGGVWSGGSGTFSPSTSNLNATYTPTATEIANGTVTLMLSTTGNGLCNQATDNIILSFTPAPVVNAGADASFCANNAIIALNGSVTIASGGVWSGGLGSFTPNNTTLNASYAPTPAEIAAGSLTLTLTSTGNNNCVAVSDSRVITFTQSPTVNAGSNGTVCANNAAISLNGSITVATGALWSGGAGAYTPNSATLNATYTPTASERSAGSVTLTLTTVGNGNCSAVSDQVTFSITPAPTANAGADRVLCANNAVTSLAGAFTVATGGIWSGGNGTFDPSTTNMSAIYTPTAAEITAGSVLLTLTTTGNGNCSAVNDQVLLTFTDAPTANAGPDVTRCANNAAVALGGSVVTATGGIWSGGTGSFSPNANTLNATYTPGAADIAAGQITLTLTTTGNGNCAPASDTRLVTYTPAPIVNAGANGTACANAPLISLSGSVTGAVGGVWSGGAGAFSPNNITLNATYMPTAAEIASGSVNLTLTSAGNGQCNPVADQVSFTITPAPTVNAGVDQTLCGNNANAVLNAAITVATGVQWSGGSGLYAPGSTAQNITYSPSSIEIANGSVTLTVTTTGNGTCAPVTDQVTLTFTPAPNASAGPDQTVSSNNANTTLAGSFNIATGIVWSGGAGTYNPANTTVNAVYTPTNAEIAAGSVILTMTTTGNGACASSSDQMTITFGAAPTANAGPDQTTCANNASVLLNGQVSIATGGIWSGGNGAYTPNSAALNATYVPGASEIAAGSVTLTLTTVGNGNSNPVSDQVTIFITPAPVVNAGANITVCANQSTAQLAGLVNNATGGAWSGGSGTFNPSNTNLNATYTPTAGEIAAGTITLTLTSTGNGLCNPVSDQVLINIAPAPVVNAGVDATVCANNPAVQLAASVSNAAGGIWSGGTGGFSPSITSLNAVYTPSTTELNNGSVTLNLTSTGNGTCAQVTDQIFIVFTQSPVASAGNDQTVCANDPTVNLNGSVTIAGGGVWSGGSGTFAPNASALNATYTPSPAEVSLGSVTLTLTSTQNGLCNPVSDAMTITIINAPVANAGNNLFACSNNPSVQLGGSVSGAGGGQWSGGAGTFAPSIAALNAVYTPTAGEVAAGTLNLTLTTIGNGNCVPVSDNVSITFTASPTAEAGTGAVFCANNASIQLNGSVTVANGGAWSGAQGSFSPNANALNAVYSPSSGELAAGSVTLTLTTTGNNGCTAVSDQVIQTFTPAPTASAGADLNSCANNAAVTLNGVVTVASGGIWSGGTGGFSPNNATLNATYVPSTAEIAAGMATLTLTTVGNGSCNAVTDQVAITIAPAPIVDAGAPQSVCANNSTVQLSGSVLNATSGAWSGGGTFSPSSSALNASYSPSAAEIAAGIATLTLTSTGNGLCNAVIDQMTITITPAPVVNAGTDGVFCSNNANIQLAGSITVANGGTWSGAQGTFSPSATALNAIYSPSFGELAAGSVTLTLTSTGNNGCTAVSDQVTYTFTPAPTVSAGTDLNSCGNNASVTLNGAITVATGALWSGGSGTFNPNNSTLNATYTPSAAEINAGVATLTLTTVGNGTCTAVSDQVVISIAPAPLVDAGAAIQVCANNATTSLNGSVGNATGAIWTGSGSFSPNASTLNAVYTPTAAEVAAGTATVTLTSTGNGLCVAVADNVVITFTPAPVVEAGPAQTLCANNANIQLAGSVSGSAGGAWTGGAGTYAPGANSLGATYTPSSSEISAGSLWLFLTSTGNGGCNAARDSVQVFFTPAPTANAGSDAHVCANSAEVSLNGAVTVATGGIWSGGAGNFTPNNTTLNASYTPSLGEIAAGQVTLTLTTTGFGNCVAVHDNVVVLIDPVPVVNAGPDQSICANNPNLQLNGFVGNALGAIWSGGNGVYVSGATATATQYQPTAAEIAAGVITFTLTSTGTSICNAISDQMIVTFTGAPVVDAGTDLSICSNNNAVQLSGSVVNANGGMWSGGNGIFSPASNVFAPVYTPTAAEVAAGSLVLTLSSTGNGNCFAVSDQVAITFTPAPVADAGNDLSVCANNPVVSLSGTMTVATGGLWSGGLGTYAPDANALNAQYTLAPFELQQGAVVLTLTSTGNGNCLAVTDQVEITVTQAPVVDAGADITACSNALQVQLSGAVSAGASTGQWSTSGTGFFAPSANDLNATYVASGLDSLNGSVNLLLTSTNNGLCASENDELVLTILPNAIAGAGQDRTVCASENTITLNGTITGNATQGSWSTNGAGSFSPDSDAPNAVYTIVGSDVLAGSVTFTWSVNSCDNAMDQMILTIVPQSQADAGSDLVVCVDDLDVLINGSVSGASATGVWSTLGTGAFQNAPSALANIYNASTQDSLATRVDLVLTATGTGVCPAAIDTVHIDILPFGTVNAGADMSACANNSVVQLSGTLQGDATEIQWTTSGSGQFFPNSTVLTPTYVPSSADATIGSVTLTLSALNSCNAATDALVLELTPAPIADAGPDQTYCEQVTQFELNGSITGITTTGVWSTNGTGSIANANALNTSYSASAADIAAGEITFTLTSQNNANCNAVVDQMTIHLTDGLVANAGPDQSVCVLGTYAQLDGQIINGAPSGLWSATGSGTFVPGPDVLNAQYHFSSADVANGSVVLTLLSTNTGTCPPVQDQLVLTFGNSSFAYAGDDQEVCANAPFVLLSGNFSSAPGVQWSSSGSGFFSNTTDADASYTLSASDIANGGVQLTMTTVSGGSCSSVSDAMSVSVQAIPQINAGADIVACTAAAVQLVGNAVNATSGAWSTAGTGTFLNANALSTLYTPSAADSTAGSVVLTLTTTGVEPCAAVSDQLVITFGGGLSATAGPDVTACSTDANVALSGAVSGTTTGVWSTTGTGSFTPSATDLNATYVPGPADFVIGDVSLVLSTTGNQGCAAGRDTLVVDYHVPPTVDAGAGVLLCDGLEDVQLSGAVQNVGSVQWFTTGTGVFSPTPDVTNATYMPSINDSIAGGVYLILTGYGTGTCGNASDSLLVDIGPTRIADAGVDQSLCADGDPIQLNGGVNGVSGGVWSTTGTGSFLPDNNTLGAAYVPSTTDMAFAEIRFVLSTTGNQGCPADADTMTVTLQRVPTVSAGQDINVCDAASTVQLAATSTEAGGVLWSTNGTGIFLPSNTDASASYQPGASDEQLGNVRLVVTSTGNGVCAAASDTLFLSFTNPLEPAFGVTNACAASNTLFMDASTTTGSPIIGWNWSFSNGATGTGPQVNTTFNAPGQYSATLTVFAQNGCSATSTRVIEVLGAPVAAFSIEGELFTESPLAVIDSASGATGWQYDFGDGNGSLEAAPVHEYADAGQYIIVQTVTNANGCSDRDSLLITIEEKDILPPKLPNAFSPNGDGVNDRFFVRGGPFETMELMVYNSWGELIFETTDPLAGWDGTHEGKPEINGVYVYTVIAKSVDGMEHDRSGKVTLVR